MDISINAKVFCSDGECGKTIRVIIDPIKKKLTHIVVQGKGLESGLEQLVPIEKILQSTAEEVHLDCTHKEFIFLESYLAYEYIPGDENLYGFEYAHYSMHPFVLPDFEDEYEYESHNAEFERIPRGDLSFRRGVKVHALDGVIGQVDEFLVSPQDHHISHLVLREGHLWGKKLVTIPVSEIDHVETDQVFLKLDKKAIEKMPAIPMRKR
jgi:hypothetical protein